MCDRGSTGSGNSTQVARVHASTAYNNDKLIVDQRCHHTLECLDQYQWDPNPNLMKEKPKHDRFSHMADALRYGLYTFETSSTTF